ncbi:MAG TPA: hypothetical protein VH000_09935 [Rhizomicrobium sp.]|jgi:hypothetical protein|nr:hypothetical protein [Rhizomicrobium sp.]
MDNFQNLVNSVWDFFREGFHNVNAVEGLIIALVATILLSSWGRLWIIALGATLVHLIADILIPVVAKHAAFALPTNLMDMSYWRYAGTLFVGYIIVIAVFFFIKRLFFRGGH